jgi:hypothetical protein
MTGVNKVSAIHIRARGRQAIVDGGAGGLTNANAEALCALNSCGQAQVGT